MGRGSRKGRASGARAVIGQLLFAGLEDFAYDFDWKHESPLRNPVTVRTFGGSVSGFVANSWSNLEGERPVVAACFGLPSKIVRGDRDVSLIQKMQHRTPSVTLNRDYLHAIFSEALIQNTIDVVLAENPSVVTTLKMHTLIMSKSGVITEAGILPFQGDYRFLGEDSDGFKNYMIWDIVQALKEASGREVEVEGAVSDEGVGVFQVRHYDRPQKHFTGLTKVSEDQLVQSVLDESIGYNQFSGNLVVGHQMEPVGDGEIYCYTGNPRHEDIPSLSRYRQLVIGFADTGCHISGVHNFGYTVQLMTELERLSGTRVIAMGDTSFLRSKKLEARTIREGGRTVIRGVTIECDGDSAQVYLNDS